MAKIDVQIKTPPTSPHPYIKPTDKKMNFANTMAKQQKVKPVINKNLQISGRRTGKK